MKQIQKIQPKIISLFEQTSKNPLSDIEGPTLFALFELFKAVESIHLKWPGLYARYWFPLGDEYNFVLSLTATQLIYFDTFCKFGFHPKFSLYLVNNKTDTELKEYLPTEIPEILIDELLSENILDYFQPEISNLLLKQPEIPFKIKYCLLIRFLKTNIMSIPYWKGLEPGQQKLIGSVTIVRLSHDQNIGQFIQTENASNHKKTNDLVTDNSNSKEDFDSVCLFKAGTAASFSQFVESNCFSDLYDNNNITGDFNYKNVPKAYFYVDDLESTEKHVLNNKMFQEEKEYDQQKNKSMEEKYLDKLFHKSIKKPELFQKFSRNPVNNIFAVLYLRLKTKDYDSLPKHCFFDDQQWKTFVLIHRNNIESNFTIEQQECNNLEINNSIFYGAEANSVNNWSNVTKKTKNDGAIINQLCFLRTPDLTINLLKCAKESKIFVFSNS